jgi:hypothetical protein
MPRLARSQCLPVLVWVAWLILLGSLVWKHASASRQPPVYDAATYVLKARNFWTNLHAPQFHNPLNLEPTFRPPGTVLVSYPLGFSADFRPFYFRTAFFPAVLIGLAVFITGWRAARNTTWQLASIAIFLSTLPTFYYFDVVPNRAIPAHWGLVDGFLGGVAALAMAAGVRSAEDRSIVYAALAALLSGLAILIKPSGILLAAAVAIAWAVLALSRIRRERALQTRVPFAPAWFLWAATCIAVADVAVLALARHSEYLSSGTFAYGAAAIAMMKRDIAMPWPVLIDIVHRGVGYWFPAWAIGGALLAVLRWRSVRSESGDRSSSASLTLPPVALAACAVAILAFGVWFWLVYAGGSMNVRYAVPFVLVSSIAAVPIFVRSVAGLPGPYQFAYATFLGLPALNLALLLVDPDPSVAWQDRTGVNVSVNRNDAVTNQAEAVIAAATASGRSATVYSMSVNYTDAIFTAVAEHARITRPERPALYVTGPVDWQRPATYRFRDILDADYLVFEPIRDAVTRASIPQHVVDFDAERRVMEAWATGLDEGDGVRLVSDSATARVLKIVDRSLLTQAFGRLYAQHRWRAEFEAGIPRLIGEDELRQTLQRIGAENFWLRDTTFDSLFKVRALRVTRAGGQLTLQLWWQPLQASVASDWSFFVHTVDRDGKIIYADQLPIGRVDDLPASNPIHVDTAILPARAAGPLRLAVGFVRPNASLPVADTGERDWDGRRVIVSVQP